MKVIAEGIETKAQLALLQNLGCNYGQGYLMSKPLPKDDLEKLLYQKKGLACRLPKPIKNNSLIIHLKKKAFISFNYSNKISNPTLLLYLTSNAHYT